MIKQFDSNPNRLGRFSARHVKIVVLALVSWSFAFAQSPPSDLPLPNTESERPILDLVPLVPAKPRKAVDGSNSEADLIERALQGEDVPNPDSMLGDVLDLIRKRGSLLEGSELSKQIPPILGRFQSDNDPASATDQTIRRLRAAEQLIRSARQLLEIEPQDVETKELVDQMRRYAVKLVGPKSLSD